MPQMLGTVVACNIVNFYTDAQIELPKMYCCSSEDNNPAFR